MTREQKIMNRVNEHCGKVVELGYEVVGVY